MISVYDMTVSSSILSPLKLTLEELHALILDCLWFVELRVYLFFFFFLSLHFRCQILSKTRLGWSVQIF